MQAGEKHVNTRGSRLPLKAVQRGEIFISARVNISQNSHCNLNARCWLMTCVWWAPPSRRSHSYSHAHARANSRVWDDTNDILFVIWTNIMYYGPNCFCTLLCAHTRTGDHQIWTRLLYLFFSPLNVFPIDHCSKDVINNLKAWLTSTFP